MEDHTLFQFLETYEELQCRIDEIKIINDSLLFKTFNENNYQIDRVFIFKYIDKSRNIAQWSYYSGCCDIQILLGTYIPISDTSNFSTVEKLSFKY